MKICEYCGKEFVPKQSRSIYCSRECQIRGFHQSRRTKVTKVCVWCGAEFETEHRGTKYCSLSCRQSAADEQRVKSVENRKPKHEPKECLHCGKEFIPRDGRQIYCCTECATQRYRLEYKSLAEERKKDKAEKKKKPKKPYYKKNDGIEEVKPQPKPIAKLSPASRRWAKMSWADLTKELLYYGLRYPDAQVMAQNNTLPKDFGLKRKKAKKCPR